MKKGIDILLNSVTFILAVLFMVYMLESCSDKDDIIEEEESHPALDSKYDGDSYNATWNYGGRILELAIYKEPSGNERKIVNLYQLTPHYIYYEVEGADYVTRTVKYHEVWRNDEFLGDFIIVPNGYGVEQYQPKLVHLPSMREITIYDFSNWTEGAEVCSECFRIGSDRNVEVVTRKEVVRDLFEHVLVGLWDNIWGSYLAYNTEDGGLMVRPYGRISGKRSVMPMEFVDEEPADGYILLEFGRFVHQDYDELTRDVEYAFTDELYRESPLFPY